MAQLLLFSLLVIVVVVVVVVGLLLEDRAEPRVAKTMRAGGSKVQLWSHLSLLSLLTLTLS